jgi:hypothetical protein
MSTYVFQFKVKPLAANKNYQRVKHAYAVVMAVCPTMFDAEPICRSYLENQHWRIISLEAGGYETTLEQFDHRPEGRECFLRAQELGVAASFSAVGVDPDSHVSGSLN